MRRRSITPPSPISASAATPGSGTYTDGSRPAGIAVGDSDMGFSIGDVDADGDADLFVSAISATNFKGNRLFRNNGDRTFTDATTAAGVRNGGWGWGSAAFDHDNDGDIDIAEVNGFPSPFFEWTNERMYLWDNNGQANFTEIGFSQGLTNAGMGKGALTLDYDRDGDLDLFITNNEGQPVLYRNDSDPSHDYLQLTLKGTQSNRDGIGSVITLIADEANPDDKQTWLLDGGSNYLTQSELLAHFGLGAFLASGNNTVDRIEVRWTSGTVDVLRNVAVNQRLHLVEGSTIIPEPATAASVIAAGVMLMRRVRRSSAAALAAACVAIAALPGVTVEAQTSVAAATTPMQAQPRTLPPLTGPSKVHLEQLPDGGWQLFHNGKPYFIKGTGGFEGIEEIVAAGGNAVRTWGVDQGIEENLDRAAELGVTVMIGIWLGHIEHGFDYNDPVQVEEQKQAVLEHVRKFKDHPALLMWALGNEMEIGHNQDPSVYIALNDMAKAVREIDPNHPITTVTAGSGMAPMIQAYCPDLDLWSINAYGELDRLAKSLDEALYTRAYTITEFGPLGGWGQKRTSWDSHLEPSSTEKAQTYAKAYAQAIAGDPRCVGSYVFKWRSGDPHSTQSTFNWWHLVNKDGLRLGGADVLEHAWTGHWPDNKAPEMVFLRSKSNGERVGPGQTITAEAFIVDRDNDPVRYEWWLTSDASCEPPFRLTGENDMMEQVIGGNSTTVNFQAPTRQGSWRVQVVGYDDRGSAATANFAFLVLADGSVIGETPAAATGDPGAATRRTNAEADAHKNNQ